MSSRGEAMIGSTILSGVLRALTDPYHGHWYYRRELSAIPFIQITACAARVIGAWRDDGSKGKAVSTAICTIGKGLIADAKVVAKLIH